MCERASEQQSPFAAAETESPGCAERVLNCDVELFISDGVGIFVKLRVRCGSPFDQKIEMNVVRFDGKNRIKLKGAIRLNRS